MRHKTTVILIAIASLVATAGSLIAWGRAGAEVAAVAATALATAALAWFTLRLVAVTQSMASEPAIVPSLSFFAESVFLDLHNAGDGAALDVDLVIEWTVDSGVVTAARTDRVSWRSSVIPQGGRVRFNPPPTPVGTHLDVEGLKSFARVAVRGAMKNSRGQKRTIDASIEEPGREFQLKAEARQQLPSNYEPDLILASEVKKIREAIERGRGAQGEDS